MHAIALSSSPVGLFFESSPLVGEVAEGRRGVPDRKQPCWHEPLLYLFPPPQPSPARGEGALGGDARPDAQRRQPPSSRPITRQLNECAGSVSSRREPSVATWRVRTDTRSGSSNVFTA